MKRALVTGSAGFLGRHFAERLERDGWDVFRVDTSGSDGREPVNAHTVFRDDETRYDLVVHAAYRVGGRAAIDGDRTALAQNLALDSALFTWAMITNPHHVLYLSSAAAYPVHLQDVRYAVRLHEDELNHRQPATPVNPDTDYGWAKLTGEKLALNAQRLDLSVSVVRVFSGYGHDQDLTYPFPAIVRRVYEHRSGPLEVWGPPGQTRDWVHVDDVVGAALAVVENEERRPVNVCTGVGTEFGDLARLTASALGRRGFVREIAYDLDRPTGVLYRVGDPGRLYQHYVPKISIQEGLYRAAAAYGLH